MPTLHDKIYGCLAASRVGSSMGAPVEGWSRERIKETHGYVDKLLPYKHYYPRTNWDRIPGTTEDGIERQKLMCLAIIRKQDRINVDDLAQTWISVGDPEKIVYKSEPMEAVTLGWLRAGVPPIQMGRMNDWHFNNALARGGQPIGLINAGDPDGAVQDASNIGLLLYGPTDQGLAWACVSHASLAEALKPNATVDSVIATALRYCNDQMRGRLERGLELAQRFSDPLEMRDEFYKYYNGFGGYYAMSSAEETMMKAYAILTKVKANPKEAILLGVNFGRDTDCLAATSGGLAGALSGVQGVPAEWIAQVDAATAVDPYTNIVCTIKEHADGIYSALQNRARKLREIVGVLES